MSAWDLMGGRWDDKIGDVWLHSAVTEKIITEVTCCDMKVNRNLQRHSQHACVKNERQLEGNVTLATYSGLTWLNKYKFQEDNKKEIIVIKIGNDYGMGENFSWEGMWRLSTNSNSLLDKLMSTFTDEKSRRNKRLTSTILYKSQH